MKKYIILHYGFIKPTEEEMAEWNHWFEWIDERIVEKAHFPQGKEINEQGLKDLPFSRDSITGYTIIEAEHMTEAEIIAQRCPFVDSTRVYELDIQ